MMDADEQEFWHERAAIMEYDGGLDRKEAEQKALERVKLRRLQRKGFK